MNQIQADILELFKTLPSSEQQELVDHLFEVAVPKNFFAQMTLRAREELHAGIAQADRGQTLTPAELRAYLAQRFPS